MQHPRPITSRNPAGGLALPGGHLFPSLRRLAFYAAAALALALPVSALLPTDRNPVSTPADAQTMTRVASGYLLKARETGDPAYYTKAGELLERSLASSPDDSDTLIAAGGLALARHDFETALRFGQRAVARAPARPAAHGVVVDALVELGRYEEALAAAQRMVDLRPDLASFTRVAYLRELYGDIEGATAAMRRAIQAGPPSGESTAWSEVQLGHLQFLTGDVDAAERAYASSLERLPGYAHATAGLARVRAARGDLSGAADFYARAAERLPLPDFVTELAAVYERLGDVARARQQRDLLEAMRRLLSANGVRADADLALFQADHGIDLQRAVEVARAEHAQRPSVRVADALAWAEYQNGDLENALRHSHEALRLGTRDPLMLYHAGVIAQAGGDLDRAYRLLTQSFGMNPRFSTLWADDLASRLRELGARRGAP